MSNCEYQAGKSFTARPDAFGIRAQVNVAKGVLPVKSIADVGAKGTMARVTFDISAMGNPKLVQNPYGNVSKSSQVYEACVAAHESGAPVAFRSETIRKQGVSSTIPLSGLAASSETVRALVAAGGHSTDEQCTDPADDIVWMRVPDDQRPDFLDTNEAPAGVDEVVARSIYDRVVAARGADSDAAVAVGAVLSIFGVDVYTK